MNKKIKVVLIVFFAIVMTVCLIMLCTQLIRNNKARAIAQQLQDLVGSTSGNIEPAEQKTPDDSNGTYVTPPADEPDEPVVIDKYATLFEENPEIIGWLKLDNTVIDYPVMYTPDEPDKYLHLDFYGEESVNGTLYLDAECDILTSDNLIIYGHNMKSGTMFGDLDNFAKESYWQEHKYITFDTIYEEQQFEIVAAFYSRIMYSDEDGFRYYKFKNADDETSFNEYASFINDNQCYDTGVEIQYGDQLLTLSTCAYQTDNGRFVVVAKKVMSDGSAALKK